MANGIILSNQSVQVKYGWLLRGFITSNSGYVYDQCPYFSFFQAQRYNWKTIWNNYRQNKYYAWVLAYKGTEVAVDRIDISNIHAKLRAFIGNKPLLHYQGLDYRNNPVFAIAYLAEEPEHQLTRWLEVEFQDFFLGNAKKVVV